MVSGEDAFPLDLDPLQAALREHHNVVVVFSQGRLEWVEIKRERVLSADHQVGRFRQQLPRFRAQKRLHGTDDGHGNCVTVLSDDFSTALQWSGVFFRHLQTEELARKGLYGSCMHDFSVQWHGTWGETGQGTVWPDPMLMERKVCL